MSADSLFSVALAEAHIVSYDHMNCLSGQACVRPGTAGLPTGSEYSRVGSSTWICPTSFVSTRIGVELVDILGNQPNSSDWDPNRT